MKTAILKVALDPELSKLDERVLAVRSLSLLKADELCPYLEPLLAQPKNFSETISREAAKTLYQAGATPLLVHGLAHPDEVRRFAARSGAGGPQLCALLSSDPWPMVRAAAAEGLLVVPSGADCVVAGLDDPNDQVVLATIKTLGELGVSSTHEQLRVMVKNQALELPIRQAALRALVRRRRIQTRAIGVGHSSEARWYGGSDTHGRGRVSRKPCT